MNTKRRTAVHWSAWLGPNWATKSGNNGRSPWKGVTWGAQLGRPAAVDLHRKDGGFFSALRY